MIIPDDMIEACGHVFAGEYDVKAYLRKDPIILDIGANVGAFSVWSTYRWPDSTIYAYEPIRESYEYLKTNTQHLKNVEIHNVAIGAHDDTARRMFYGGINRGQSSLYQGVEQRDYGETVNVISASSLPYAHFVKIDTEGAELEIVENMTFKPEIYVIEYHKTSHRTRITEILSDDFVMFNLEYTTAEKGIIKFANKSITGQN